MDDIRRYSRQIPLIGQEGQIQLLQSKVVLIGCGADGSLIADRLVRAGVGHLTIIDPDTVEISNLQRQFLYDEEDVGIHKAIAAQRRLQRINSQVNVQANVDRVTVENAETYLLGADLIMDGTDNPETRFLVNEVCVKHGISWVTCGVNAGSGQVMTIVPHETACLRCVFPDIPLPDQIPNANEVGTYNPIVATIPGIAVSEALKLLVGKGERLQGLFRIDLWDNSIEVYDQYVEPRPDCPTCVRGEYNFLDR